MDLKKVRTIRLVLVVVALVMAWIATWAKNSLLQNITLTLAVVGIIAGAVFEFFYWRCPGCGAHLGRHAGDYCKWCGEKLY